VTGSSAGLKEQRPARATRTARCSGGVGRAFRPATHVLLVAAAAAALLACRAPSPGRGSAGARGATRIVSLVPAATEILFSIGAGSKVIAVSSFDHYPPAVESLPRVGALLDPDLERIIALRPDLVVVFEGQGELRDKLMQADIPTFGYPRPTVAGILRAMRSLGRRVGLAARADRQASAIERQLSAVRRRVAALPPVRTMLVIGREPGTLRSIYVSGGIGFLDDLLEIAGGSNVFGSVQRENLQVTTEAILAARPDAIVEVVASQPWTAADIAREEHVWDDLSSLPAVANRRVSLLVGDELVIPGPRIPRAAEELAETLHPKVARSE
jgi:iron complex transport system substrate-binding protein